MSENKKKKKSAANTVALLPILVGGIGGFFIGMFLAKNGMNKLPIPVWAELLFIIAVLLVIIVIHEAGHLVMGLATGYKFVSFRVGPLTFIKEDGGIKLRLFSVMGTAGQCLLMPPDTDSPENAPYFLYHLGGGLFNAVTAALCGIFMLITDSKTADLLLATVAVLSLFLGITNLLPMGKAAANDGTNLYLLKRSPALRKVLYRQLYINGLLYQGMLPRDIPSEYFADVTDDGKMGIHSCVMPMLQGSLAVDIKDFTAAQAKFEYVLNDEKLIPIYRNECACELIFCKIMNGASKEEIDELYDKNIRSYVKQTKSMLISKRRLLYAYNLIILGDEKAAAKEYEEAQKMRKTYPCKGELESELDIIEYIKEHR
ncbi:MAG: M50 family metallopeptidase [Ruminococcus sp.]|nr:M50 family metallopeptidase [Ruminococcus sp.]